MSLLQKKTQLYDGRVSASIARFGPYSPRNWPTPSVKCLALSSFGLRPKLGDALSISSSEIAVCTIFCKKKVFEKQRTMDVR
jgi:hypothetical protein